MLKSLENISGKGQLRELMCGNKYSGRNMVVAFRLGSCITAAKVQVLLLSLQWEELRTMDNREADFYLEKEFLKLSSSRIAVAYTIRKCSINGDGPVPKAWISAKHTVVLVRRSSCPVPHLSLRIKSKMFSVTIARDKQNKKVITETGF